MRVRIKKIAEATGGCPAAAWDSFAPGTQPPAGYSIPVEYWLEGELLANIEIGKPVVVARDIRNGVECPGIFRTSPVSDASFETGMFRTRNSVYSYEFI